MEDKLQEMQKLQVLIVTGGRPVAPELLRLEMAKSGFVIAADGGIHNFLDAALEPDLIVGDFDSAPQSGWRERFSHIPVVTFPKEKDYTDTELAIAEALKRPCERICILGGTGTRMDHTLANMMLLKRIEDEDREGLLLDEHNAIVVLGPGKHRVSKGLWRFFSLVPLEGLLVVTLEGFKYPLHEARIPQGSTVTISNEFVGEEGLAWIHEGSAFMMLTRD